MAKPEDMEELAAEFALGSLPPAEREKAESLMASGSIRGRTVGALPQPGKSYELRVLGGGRDKPQSLGVIDASFRIPANMLGKMDPSAMNDTMFAVSLEPEGESPTSQPTGPVMFTGKLVATE